MTTTEQPPRTDQAAEVCAKCGHPIMRDWGGYGHAPGYRGRRHVVTVATRETEQQR